MLSPTEQQALIRQAQWFLTCFLATFHNYLAVMVHGKKMTRLVPDAIAGDREAFLKAIQIDRTLLTSHPFFSAERARAAEIGDISFLKKISYREQNPTVRGRIRHPTLWALFSVLDGLHSLDGVFTHAEILRMCDDAQIDRLDNRIEDLGYLSKRIADFRRYQRTGGVSTQ
jgi:hypothetical protein